MTESPDIAPDSPASNASALPEQPAAHVDTGRMAAVVKQRSSALTAEQRGIHALFDTPPGGREPDFDPSHYLGATGAIIDQVPVREREGNGKESQ